MLVNTMSITEMLAELKKDSRELYASNLQYLTSKNVRQLRRADAKFPSYLTREYTSSRKNKYICTFVFSKRSDVFNSKALEAHSAVIETPEGLSTIATVYSTKFQKEILYIFRPHVFKRFKERMNVELDGIPLLRYFAKRNTDTILHEDYIHKEGDTENDIMLTICDGALFGTKSFDGDNICYTINTFIANDTMKEGYKSAFNNRHNSYVDTIKENMEFFGHKEDYYFDPKRRKE